MHKGVRFITVFLTGAVLAGAAHGVMVAQEPDSAAQDGPQAGQGGRRGMRGGMGGFPGGARGLLGTVTETTADHYIIKTDQGETYTVHYSVNTRIVKQGAGRGRGAGPAGADGKRGGTARDTNNSADYERPNPEPLKPTDIKVGDVITAGGEMDAAAKSVGAVFIVQLDPERARQMREMQANYGKTWLAGRITAIDGTKITIEGMVDHTPHAIEVDENTSFRKRRESITMADMQTGDQLRAEGAVKGGVFLATTINSMGKPNPGQQSGQQPAPPQ